MFKIELWTYLRTKITFQSQMNMEYGVHQIPTMRFPIKQEVKVFSYSQSINLRLS